jgi:mediator of RNA polymerase II transcription subunit 8
MQTAEKQMDASLTAIASRIDSLKESLMSLLGKLERDQSNCSWPTVLESFATLSGQVNMLLRQLRHDKTPPLQNSVVLPVTVSQQRDEELERLTEGRVPVFHHEIVPDYLRTKLDLDLESQEQQLEAEAAKLSTEMAQVKM